MTGFLTFVAQHQREIWRALTQHVWLVAVSVGIGLAIALPVGIVLSRHRTAAKYVLAVSGALQTIPSLVLLGFVRYFMGIGVAPAIAVLSLYAILPILRNTYTGITEVDPSYVEAARGIGMTDPQLLFRVELPLALSTIIGGLRMSVVYIVSWATLACLIGAGGLGDLIWSGLGTYSKYHIYAGAVPAAVLAVALGGLVGLAQRWMTPRGIRRGG